MSPMLATFPFVLIHSTWRTNGRTSASERASERASGRGERSGANVPVEFNTHLFRTAVVADVEPAAGDEHAGAWVARLFNVPIARGRRSRVCLPSSLFFSYRGVFAVVICCACCSPCLLAEGKGHREWKRDSRNAMCDRGRYSQEVAPEGVSQPALDASQVLYKVALRVLGEPVVHDLLVGGVGGVRDERVGGVNLEVGPRRLIQLLEVVQDPPQNTNQVFFRVEVLEPRRWVVPGERAERE